MKMKALIIEDEPMARASLLRLLGRDFPDVEVIATIASVRAAVEWFRDPGNEADMVFMDVELSDGNCFEIFRQTEVRGNVIMTTAYDHYAVKAFEVNSVDYLLKPVDADALRRAVGRVAQRIRERAAAGREGAQAGGPAGENAAAAGTGSGPGFDFEKLAEALAARSAGTTQQEYRRRFIVRINDKIVPVDISDVAYFYSEEKNTFMITSAGLRYVIDMTLDEVCDQIDPAVFFRVSRRCVVSMGAISSITRQIGGRLRLEVVPASSFEVTVSRSRSDDFLKWIER